MSAVLLHFGGDFSHAEPDSFPSLGADLSFIVRCGLRRDEVEHVRRYQDWANAFVRRAAMCPECVRIVAVETGAAAGSA
ncbi:hypothetical protein [Corallococcus sp. RDP092CA]|uniref:hypothetical protein n=1 Tax=Corallococcus sp. RDP092CA TaxID=3109369 RepID=UPI0035B2C1B9